MISIESRISHTLSLQSLPSQIGGPDLSLPFWMMMMMYLFPTLLLSSLLSTLLASPVPDNDLSRVTKPSFGLDSIHLTPGPGLPPLESIPGISIEKLLKAPRGIGIPDNSEEQPTGSSLPRSPILPRGQACIQAGCPLTYVPPLSSYMWELTAMRVVYNYLRLLGQTECTVPSEGVVFVNGWVNGYFVQVMGASKWGLQDPGGKTVASHCEDVAFGMEAFLVRNGGGCEFPFDGYKITGGAATARGNGDLWVST